MENDASETERHEETMRKAPALSENNSAHTNSGIFFATFCYQETCQKERNSNYIFFLKLARSLRSRDGVRANQRRCCLVYKIINGKKKKLALITVFLFLRGCGCTPRMNYKSYVRAQYNLAPICTSSQPSTALPSCITPSISSDDRTA
jgi:hypothetical protein